MSRVRPVAAIVLCAGIAAGLAGLPHLPGLPSVPGLDIAASSTNRDSEITNSDSTRGDSDTRHRGSDNTHRDASPETAESVRSARMAAAQDLVSAREVAVKTRNKSAWMATVDIRRSRFGKRQSMLFDNLMTLPLGQFSFGTVHPALTLAPARADLVGPQAWVATVPGTYSLTGFDRSPRPFEATYTLVRRPGGWRVADNADGSVPLQLWDLPGLKVVRGRSGIVIGNAPVTSMRDYSAIADSAIRRVSGVWGAAWNSRAVLVTPSTMQEYASLLSRSVRSNLDQVAAVAQGVIDPGKRAQGDRIVINPKAFTALQRDGRRMVVTHELTHVAARSSTTGPVPTWLSEGMADYIGYLGLGLPRERVAHDLLTLVRAGKGPKALPTSNDFDPSRTTTAPSYSGSWLAVSRLVDLYGQARVVDFYRVVAGGACAGKVEGLTVQPDPDARAASVFPRTFGVTQAQFVDGLKRYRQTLAHARR